MGLQKPGLYLPLFIDSKDGFIFSTSIPEIHSTPLQKCVGETGTRMQMVLPTFVSVST